MSDNIKCEVCNQYDATSKDYRFIDQLSFAGKCYLCEWCVPLNDVTLYQIAKEKLDPKSFCDDFDDEEVSDEWYDPKTQDCWGNPLDEKEQEENSN